MNDWVLKPTVVTTHFKKLHSFLIEKILIFPQILTFIIPIAN